MTTLDYIIDAALILLVLLQVRPSRFGLRAILLPLAIAGAVGAFYLRAFPTAGNDLELVVTLTVVGALLGTASGLATRVWRGEKAPMVQASVLAAILWLVGMIGRAVFQFWADGAGANRIAQFSMDHHITGAAPWVAALVLMALAEVIARVAVLTVRARLATPVAGSVTTDAAPAASLVR